jgi:hypothetical protein
MMPSVVFSQLRQVSLLRQSHITHNLSYQLNSENLFRELRTALAVD